MHAPIVVRRGTRDALQGRILAPLRPDRPVLHPEPLALERTRDRLHLIDLVHGRTGAGHGVGKPCLVHRVEMGEQCALIAVGEGIAVQDRAGEGDAEPYVGGGPARPRRPPRAGGPRPASCGSARWRRCRSAPCGRMRRPLRAGGRSSAGSSARRSSIRGRRRRRRGQAGGARSRGRERSPEPAWRRDPLSRLRRRGPDRGPHRSAPAARPRHPHPRRRDHPRRPRPARTSPIGCARPPLRPPRPGARPPGRARPAAGGRRASARSRAPFPSALTSTALH